MYGHTYVDSDKLAGIDWLSFDEIVLSALAARYALVIYHRPGREGSTEADRRLVVRLRGETNEAIEDRIRVQAGSALDEGGWRSGACHASQ